MPDRGFRNDMKQLSVQCKLCEWVGLFKDYEVKQSYFKQIVFITVGKTSRYKRIFSQKTLSLSDLEGNLPFILTLQSFDILGPYQSSTFKSNMRILWEKI